MANAFRLSEADHAKVTAAVTAAEAATDGEIVTIVAARSDSYHDVVLHWAMLIMFLALAVLAVWPQLLERLAALLEDGWEHHTSHGQMLALLFGLLVVKFLVARFVIGLDPVRMALTPGWTKTRRVRRRAIEFFRAAAERRTRARTGVLLYLSLAEHRAEIVADEAIHSQVSQETWGRAMAALIDAVRDGRAGDGMAEAVSRIGAVLAEHFPKTGDDVNELPDRLIEL